MDSFDEISETLFEIDFGSCCSIDGGWLDFFLKYKGLSLALLNAR